MKSKTARRVLTRNAYQIARHNAGQGDMKPTLARRVKEATRTLIKGEPARKGE